MKKLATVCSLVVLLIGVMALNAQAIPITGEINFSGSFDTDFSNMTLATQFTSFPISVVGFFGGTGSFSPLSVLDIVTFNHFGFRTPNITGTPFLLWTITKESITYNWYATSLAVLGTGVVLPGATTFVTVGGSGLAQITGSGTEFDDTVGSWNLTATSAGSTRGTFGESNSVASVPEPSTLILIGTGLLGLLVIPGKKSPFRTRTIR